jgi:group I intron endonuclease
MKSGLYKITCLINGYVYVGQSKNIAKRIIDHKSKLKRNVNANRLLQADYNKYGPDAFLYTQILDIEPDRWDKMERTIIESHKPKIYNLDSGGRQGFSRDPSTLEKLSEMNNGEGNGMYGKTHTDEVRQRISRSKIGDKNPNYGKKPHNYIPRTPELLHYAKLMKWKEFQKIYNINRNTYIKIRREIRKGGVEQ